jgi:hypothetical protein
VLINGSTEGAATSVRDQAGERKPLPGFLLVLALALLALPAGASAQAPVNDNYLESLALNSPGERLERKSTLRDVRNTAEATVQADVLSPPNSGGPAEATTCGGASYGKTVWYDFYPDVTGLVRLRASGFDSVINVVPFNRTSFLPRFGRAQCANESASTNEEFLAEVAKGAAYTVQIGGVGGAGGNLEFLFDFLANTDGDGVLDDTDRCPRLRGTGNRGCPVSLRAETLLRALPTAGGIRIDRLAVTLNRKSRVEVRCKGCGKQVKRGKRVRFPRLKNRELPAGSRLEIRATRRGAFGSYTAYRIQAGNFKKITRCMNPGSRKLRRRCG